MIITIKNESGETVKHTFDLSALEYRDLPDDIDETQYSSNEFECELPASKDTLTWKLLSGKDETLIDRDLKGRKKINPSLSAEITTRLRHSILSVNGEDDKQYISNYVDNMLSRDSLFLRGEIKRVAPDVDLTQWVDIGEGEEVEIQLPMTLEFFWPKSQ